MGAMVSQITSITIVYSTVYSGANQRKHQSSASLAFARGIHRWPVDSPHKGPATRKNLPFDDVIMIYNLHSPEAENKQLSHFPLFQFANKILLHIFEYKTIETNMFSYYKYQDVKHDFPL